MKKGKLIIISGPSGSGKDTIMQGVFKKIPNIVFSISSITRPMRCGEVEGEKYHFISREEFESMIKNDQLLEYNIFVGNYYGTPKAPVIEANEKGQNVLLEVDVNGAAQVRKKMPQAVSIFIMPPSLEILEQRLRDRKTDSEEAINNRILAAKGEIERAKEFDYTVINDNLDDAINQVIEIINK